MRAAALFCLLFLALLTPRSSPAAPPPSVPPSVASAQSNVPPLVVTPKMQRYAHTRYALYFGETLYGWLVLWGLGAFGLSARLRTGAERLTQNAFGRLALYGAGLLLALTLLQFPLSWYSGFWMERAYGLSNQSFGAWLSDLGKGLGVNFVLGVPLFALLLGLIRRSPRRWSLWLWTALVPILALGIFVAPLVLDPVFNTFTPLPPGPLRTRLQALEVQAGIPKAPIYVVDKSRQTNTTNAYVTGLGSSARIVLWDTTLKALPEDEVVGVVGHEMGHYVLKHVPWGYAESLVGLLLLLPLAQILVQKLIARWGARWKVRGLTDTAAAPLFLLTLSVLSFLADPLVNGLSRRVEHQADAYGLAATHNGPALARTFVYFAAHDLSDPYPPPAIKFWLYSHPPIGERIDFVLGRKTRTPSGM